MSHFDLWQWADFVRGLGDAAARAAMETHLSGGCERCRTTVTTLSLIAKAATSEAGYEPPDHALRYAAAVYTLGLPEKMSWARLIARLVHDSARDPLPAGIRSQDRMSRRVVYVAGDYHIDLQLERQPASGLITLIGQLAAASEPTLIADVPVWLMQRESLVESTTCNAFGEFQLEYEPRGDLLLYVPLREAGKRLEIPLNQLTPGGGVRYRTAVGPTAAKRTLRRKSEPAQ